MYSIDNKSSTLHSTTIQNVTPVGGDLNHLSSNLNLSLVEGNRTPVTIIQHQTPFDAFANILASKNQSHHSRVLRDDSVISNKHDVVSVYPDSTSISSTLTFPIMDISKDTPKSTPDAVLSQNKPTDEVYDQTENPAVDSTSIEPEGSSYDAHSVSKIKLCKKDRVALKTFHNFTYVKLLSRVFGKKLNYISQYPNQLLRCNYPFSRQLFKHNGLTIACEIDAFLNNGKYDHVFKTPTPYEEAAVNWLNNIIPVLNISDLNDVLPYLKVNQFKSTERCVTYTYISSTFNQESILYGGLSEQSNIEDIKRLRSTFSYFSCDIFFRLAEQMCQHFITGSILMGIHETQKTGRLQEQKLIHNLTALAIENHDIILLNEEHVHSGVQAYVSGMQQ